MIDSPLVIYVVVWAIAMAAVVYRTWTTTGAGLMLAYCFQMFLLYWVGAAIHTLPWADLPETDLVQLGMEQATYAMIAFAIGALLIGPKLVSRRMQAPAEAVSDLRLPRAYIVYGIGSYFVLAPTIGRVSGFQAVSAIGSQLVVVGCCLNCWKAWKTGGQPALGRALAPALLIPCVTIVMQGFLGFGVMALSVIMIFCAQFFRPRWVLLACFSIATYAGLCVFITYMKGREEMRATMWNRDATLSERIDKFSEKAAQFELFDPTNEEHLMLVDGRLDQDTLAGAAVNYLDNTGAYAYGDTLVQALEGMVPRIIWPNKPVAAGSSGLVSEFTGMQFANGTSVGIGPVMELYANFATAGVWIGFLGLGIMLKVIDVMAGLHLKTGNWHGFALWCLVGISFLNVSGSFVEVSMGALASVALAKFVNGMLARMKKKKAPVEEPETGTAEIAGARTW